MTDVGTHAPTPARAGIGSNSLPELASRIVTEHEAIQRSPYVVMRAIGLGKLLIEAKNHDGQHGRWSKWLKENCKQMTERNAQRYMNLAVNQPKLEEIQRKKSTPEKRHTVSDLTLNEAYRLIKPPTVPRPKNPYNEFVAAEDNLIDKLEALGTPEAIRQAADMTAKHLKAVVADLPV